MAKINWKKCANPTVRKRLTEYIETRNKIAHGKQLPISKAQVVGYKAFVELLADKLDATVAAKVKLSTGKVPW